MYLKCKGVKFVSNVWFGGRKVRNELTSFNMITLRMKKNPLSCLMQLLVLNDEIMDYEYGLMGPGILVFVVSFVKRPNGV
jgi:hypothetical protein